MKDKNVIAGLLEDISMDALLYFTTHALVVVAVCALTFFLLGLYVGFLTWGKFKRRARAYYEEIQLQRSEIANLKRRLSERNKDEPEEDASPSPTPVVNLAPPPRESLASVVLGKPPPSATSLPLAPEPSVSPEPTLTPTAPKAPEPLPKVEAKATESEPALKTEAPPEAKVSHVPKKKVESAPKPSSQIPGTLKEKTKHAPPEPDSPATTESSIASARGAITQALVRSVDEPRADSPKMNGAEPAVAFESKAAAPSSSEVESSLRSGIAVNDERLGIVYHTRPERYDDLTLLRGIGEALHLKLQEHGVYTFRQIALWTEDNIKEFDIRLAAKDRIHREQWVKQARNLHFLKYGEQIQA